jgi:hypothetical protein
MRTPNTDFDVKVGLHDVCAIWTNDNVHNKLAVAQAYTTNVKVKVRLHLVLTEHHTMEGYWGSGSIAPRIFYLGTRWRWVVSLTPRPLYLQGNSPWYPLERRLREPQSRSGRGGEEKHSQPLSGQQPLIIQPVAQRYTTELSRLLYDEWEQENPMRDTRRSRR